VGVPHGDPATAGPALLEAGATLFTVGLDGPDYDDLVQLKAWIDWRTAVST